MLELAFAVLSAALAAGLVIAFRRQRSFKRQLDRLVLDYNLLANRVLLLTLNRVPAQPIGPLSPEEPSDSRAAPEKARTEIHHQEVLRLGRVDGPKPDENARKQHEGFEALHELVIPSGDAA
jgi:hypothetical protein